jgi:hypothetical protein
MKTLCIAILIGTISFNAIAQKIIEKHINFSNKESVELDIQITDSIRIQTWNKNEVFARASVSINEDKDNDVYQTKFKDSGSSVVISASFKSDYFNKSDENIETSIYWDIYIPEKVDFSVETINGDLTIAGNTSEIDASTISGFIDFTVPAGKKADLTMGTVTGSVYSNHDFEKTGQEKSHSRNINSKINGGGIPVILKTISDDIFFRVEK